MMSIFEGLEELPPDPIFGLTTAFRADSRQEKANLGVGAYQTDEGESYVLSVVRKAEARIFEQQLNKSYLPIAGDGTYIDAVLQLIFGGFADRACAVQTLGGTGALHIGAELAAAHLSKRISLSDPTWPNHKPIFHRVGMEVGSYPYYSKGHFLFDDFLQAIEQMEKGSLILLQGPCHNPTGVDPTVDQWKEISASILKRGLIPFFDVAYMGLASGLEEDSWPIRHFVEEGHEMLLAFSFSKNMGLYGERVGLLAAVTADHKPVLSHLKKLIRVNYSNPPLQGERIASTILQSNDLRNEWEEEMEIIRTRIEQMRMQLRKGLERGGCPMNLSHMERQKGMFSLTGIGAEQVARLQEEYAIYMPKNGRINVAGLNQENLPRVIDAFLGVMK